MHIAHQLSELGHSVIMTLHQPSSRIFNMLCEWFASLSLSLSLADMLGSAQRLPTFAQRFFSVVGGEVRVGRLGHGRVALLPTPYLFTRTQKQIGTII